jgi:two-component system sensor histidine kinase KdpD
MQVLKQTIRWPTGFFVLGTSGPRGFVYALAAVGVTTLAIGLVRQAVDLGHVGAIYLVPVMIAAIRWGLGPALVASAASTVSCAFFFYPPYYSLQIQSFEQIVDLSLFTLVGVVTSHLVVSLREHAEQAERATNEARMRADAEHLREALIGSVSHELRTPLV